MRIGTVSVAVKDPENPEMVPHKVDPLYDGSQEILRHLRWLMQKDQLQQDIFLIGYSPPRPPPVSCCRVCFPTI